MDATAGGQHPDRTDRWRMPVWFGALALLIAPWVAMQFTDEVAWTLSDFVVFGGILLAACGTWELAIRASHSLAYRAGVAIAVVGAFLLVRINLAVGIIGTEDHPANRMFFVVLLVAIGGALLARLRPRGMAIAMTATAATQAVVGALAVLGGHRAAEVVLLSLFYIALWLVAAALFMRTQSPSQDGVPTA